MGAAMLVLFRGLPGTGKSTLSRAVAAHLGAPILDRDILKATIVQQYGDTLEAAILSYVQLRELVALQVQVGLPVVVDAPFTGDAELAPFLQLGRSLTVPIKLVYCVAPPEVIRGRIEGREGAVSRVQWGGADGWTKFEARLEADPAARRLLRPDSFPEGADVLVVRTDREIAACVQEIRDWLGGATPAAG
jgi:predicted kinase